MSDPRQMQWGTTPPISIALPTDHEKELNDELLAELKKQNNFEAVEETDRRSQVLNSLQNITTEFVKSVGRMKGRSPSVIEDAGGKVFTFGSYRLGVYGPGSDIDTLIVAPKFVVREDFFDTFPSMLQKMSPPGAIEEITCVPDAHVPIIKFEYSKISIDLIFARLNVSSVPLNLDLKDTSLLRGLDETDLRSINGTRVTDEILALVPQVKTFRHALRAIKLWAQRRAIYANVIGFPGGVAWAMMVARICQLYPMATGSVIVGRFFHLMSTWPWPRPVMLKNIDPGPLQVRVWNPQIYSGDKRHLMPIITPAYPSMCATHNITYSTKKIITRELRRGEIIVTKIIDGKNPWDDLFKRHTFFTSGYKYYLSIVSASRTKDAQHIWSGLVQSKVRRLVTGIEVSDAGIDIAHPYNKGFDRIHQCKNEDEEDKVLRGCLDFQDVKKTEARENGNGTDTPVVETDDSSKSPNVDKQKNDAKASNIIYTTTFYVGIDLFEGAKSLDISFPVAEFKRQCTEWTHYDPSLNSLHIVHVKRYDLPADVFEPGEPRPARPEKLKKRKRSAAETDTDGMELHPKRRIQQSNGGPAAAPVAAG